jgi:diguanylate cyclase (GGDEF)-like protein
MRTGSIWKHHRRLRSIVWIASATICVASITAQPSKNSPQPVRILSTVRQVHELPVDQAAKSLPVHLHAEVTYFDPYNDPRHATLFVHDSTGGIYVLVPNRSSWPQGTPAPGSIVDVTGVSAPGDYASIVVEPNIRVIGNSHRPLAGKPVTLTHLLTGVEDSQLVEIEGIVESVSETKTSVILDMAMQDGSISAMTVRLTGNAAALFNHDRQLTGFRLMFPSLKAVVIEAAGPRDPFALPLSSINSLSRFQPGRNSSRIVHLRGIVTLQWPGNIVCFQDETQALCVSSRDSTSLQTGQHIDVVGFPSVGGYRPTLYHSTIKPGAHGNAATPTPISAQEALRGNYDGRLVQLEGQLVGYDLEAKDQTLLVSSGTLIFHVVIASGSEDTDHLASLRVGSILRVKGVCAVELDALKTSRGDGTAVTTAFRILSQSPKDIAVLKTPSWWTPAHSLSAFGLSALIAIAVLGWVVVLRRRVYQQTRMLRESEERFRHMAQHDLLTGLPTRMLLHDRLQVALERGRRFKTNLAVLMIDLDNFKHVNDSLGHDAGDQTLKISAERLLSAIRSSDTAARMGGDEFLVLLADIANEHEAESVASKIRIALSAPIQLPNQEIPVSASIGVCVISNGAIDAAMLLKKADVAMYRAKGRGRNCFEIFSDDLVGATLNKLDLQTGLGYAVARNELELQYQPMISFESGRVMGFEALIRWRSREHGLIMPNDFIPVAEESGLIIPIGEWVLNEASRQIAELERQYGRTFLLAVNLSPRQLLHPGLVRMIEQTLLTNVRPFGSLTLEITETTLISDAQPVRDTLERIRDLGVQLAIDDFGIGFSSLSYITRFPADWIKIDRSLICNCTTDRSSLAVLRAIVTMAHALGIRLVAEGVETKEQYLLLKQEQCNVVQGYYLSRPLDLTDLPAFIASPVGLTDQESLIRFQPSTV